jgi:hypothetical protein
VDLVKEMEDSGLKIMTALVNKIYMSGVWPKDYITKEKSSKEMQRPQNN